VQAADTKAGGEVLRLDAGRKRVKDDARQSPNMDVVRLGRPAAWRKASPPAVTFATFARRE